MATITIGSGNPGLVSDFLGGEESTAALDRLAGFNAARLVYEAAVDIDRDAGPIADEWAFSFEAQPEAPFDGNAARGFSGRIGALTVSLDTDAGPGLRVGPELYRVDGLDIALADFLDDPAAAEGIFDGIDILRAGSGPIDVAAAAARALAPGRDVIAGRAAETDDRVRFDGLVEEFAFAGTPERLTVTERASDPLTLTLVEIDRLVFADGSVVIPGEDGEGGPEDFLALGPVAVDDAVVLPEDAGGALPVSELLANDTGFRADPATGEPLALRVTEVSTRDVTLSADSTRLIVDPALLAGPAAGETEVITFDYTVSDGEPATADATASVSLTITGTGAAPEIDGSASTLTGAVTERSDADPRENRAPVSAEGSLVFADADAAPGETFGARVEPLPEPGQRFLGQLSLADPVAGAGGGSVGWSFLVGDRALDGFSAEVSLAQSYRVTVTDATGARGSEVVTITLNGRDDAPEVVATGVETETDAAGPVALFSGVSVDTVDQGPDGAAQAVTDLTLTVTGVRDTGAERLILGGREIALVEGTEIAFGTGAPGEPGAGGAAVSQGPGGALAVALSGLALSGAEAAALLSGARYAHDGAAPSPGIREVSLSTLSDSGRSGGGDADTAMPGVAGVIGLGVALADNAPPVNALPGGPVSTPEETGLALPGVSISDPDAGEGAMTTTVSVGAGTLFVATDGPAEVQGGGTADVVITGPVPAVNAALAGLVYTPGADFAGTDTLQITTSDNGNTGTGGARSDTDSLAIEVTPVNDPPEAADDTATVERDGPPAVIAVLANDTDPEDGTPSLAGLDTAGTLGTVTQNADGTVTYDPAGAFPTLGPGEVATDRFAYAVTDSEGLADSAEVVVTVVGGGANAAPVQTLPDGPLTTAEDTGLSLSGLAIDDPDAGDGQLTTTLAVGAGVIEVGAGGADVSGDGTGTVTLTGTLAQINAALAGARYLPPNDFAGSDTLTMTTSDNGNTGAGGPLTDSDSLGIEVTPVNDAPVATDDIAGVDRDGPARVIAVLANDRDVEDGRPDLSALDTTGTVGRVTQNADGTVTYDPAGRFPTVVPGSPATDSFAYTVTDSDGATDTATVTVTISRGEAPPVARDDAFTVGEDDALTALPVLGNDSDEVDGVPELLSVDAAGLLGEATVGTGGTIAYRTLGQFEALGPGDTGVEVFSYTVRDSAGFTDTAEVTVTVTGVNDPPVALDDLASVGEGATVTLAPLANDADAEDGDVILDTLDLAGLAGRVTRNADDTLTYDPAGAFDTLGGGDSATETFAYTVRDSDGARDTARVTITVIGDNAPPVARDDQATAGEDGPPVEILPLANDADAEDGAPQLLALDTAGTLGAVSRAGDRLIYDPAGRFESLGPGDTATDSFGYTVIDSAGALDTATVTVTITGANDEPVAGDDAITLDEDAAATIAILANDSDAEDGDVILDSLDLAGVTGAVTRNADGSVTYAAAGAFDALGPGDTATDSFSYLVRDSAGALDSAVVTLTVTGVNDAPEPRDDSASVSEDGPAIPIDVLANDADAEDGTPALLSFDPSGLAGSLTRSGDELIYDPDGQFEALDAGQTAVESFTYTVRDSDGATATASVAITVEGAPDVVPGISVLDAGFVEDATAPTLVTVQLDAAATAPVTFDLTSGPSGFTDEATPEAPGVAEPDFVPVSALGQTIPAGSTSATVPVTILADARFEPDEFFAVTLSGVSGATVSAGSAIVAILNDDPPPAPFADTFGADDVIGSAADETIFLVADGQNDRFDAAGGIDTLDLTTLPGGNSVDLPGELVNSSAAGLDTIIGFEDVVGSPGRDVIFGDDGANRIASGTAGTAILDPALLPPDFDILDVLAAGDSLFDGGGVDTLLAGGGDHLFTLAPDGVAESEIRTGGTFSALDLRLASSAVTARLDLQGGPGLVLSGGGFGDQPGSTVSGFRGVVGGEFADTILAIDYAVDGGGADSVALSAPEGFLQLSPDGVTDTQFTGGGESEFLLSLATDGVFLRLGAPPGATAISGGGLGTQLGGSISGFDSVTGSPFSDDLFGGGLFNFLDGADGPDDVNGEGGDDTLLGGAGDDTLDSGTGSDVLNGGGGADIFFVDISGFGLNVVEDFAPGTDVFGVPALAGIDNPPDSFRTVAAGAPSAILGEGLTVFAGTTNLAALTAGDIAGFLDTFGTGITGATYAPDVAGGPVLVAVSDGTDTVLARVDDTIGGFAASEVDPVVIFEGIADPDVLDAEDFLGFTRVSPGPITIDSPGPRIATTQQDVYILNVDDAVGDTRNPDFEGAAEIVGFDPFRDSLVLSNITGSMVTATDVINENGFVIDEDPINGRVTFAFAGPGPGDATTLIVSGPVEIDADNDNVLDWILVDTLPPNTEAPAPIAGTPGDDLFEGVPDGAAIDGGAGRDTVVYPWSRAEVAHGLEPDGTIVLTGPDERADTLTDIERVTLSDGVLVFDAGESGAAVHRLYAAALGRLPKEEGLLHWAEAADARGLAHVAGRFVESAEFEARIGGSDDPGDVVTALFDTVLGRAPGEEGLAHWTGRAETLGLDGLLMAFAGSPENRATTAADTEDGIWVLG